MSELIHYYNINYNHINHDKNCSEKKGGVPTETCRFLWVQGGPDLTTEILSQKKCEDISRLCYQNINEHIFKL